MDESSAKIYEAVGNALEKTFEALAFIELFPLFDKDYEYQEKEEVVERGSVMWAKVPFVRPTDGSIQIVLSPELAANITETIYGFMEEGALTEEVMLDAVAEITNVLAGRFFNEILNKGVSFELGLPEKGILENESEVPTCEGKTYCLNFAVEGHKLTVSLNGDNFNI